MSSSVWGFVASDTGSTGEGESQGIGREQVAGMKERARAAVSKLSMGLMRRARWVRVRDVMVDKVEEGMDDSMVLTSGRVVEWITSRAVRWVFWIASV